MCEVYEQAFLTLAALGDDTGDKGLFLDREVLDYPSPVSSNGEIEQQSLGHVRLPCIVKGKQQLEHVYVAKSLIDGTKASRIDESCFGQELEASRWVTRGWILQERLLSRRIVYFGQRQLYWECQTIFRNEDGTSRAPDVFRTDSEGFVKHRFVENLMVDDFATRFGVGKTDVHSVWMNLVSHYSSRNLSVATDKLRAISGIAEALGRRFSLKSFHFRVWMNQLSEELAWFAEGTLTRATNNRRGKRSRNLRQEYLLNLHTPWQPRLGAGRRGMGLSVICPD